VYVDPQRTRPRNRFDECLSLQVVFSFDIPALLRE